MVGNERPPKRLVVVGVGTLLEAGWLDPVGEAAALFGLEVWAREERVPSKELRPAFDRGRQAYRADTLAELVRSDVDAQTDLVLGIFTDPLYLPGMEHVWGGAATGRRAAVVTTQGLSAGADHLGGRLARVVAHQAAVLMGLSGCPTAACAARPVKGPAELDQWPLSVCPRCQTRLGAQSAPR